MAVVVLQFILLSYFKGMGSQKLHGERWSPVERGLHVKANVAWIVLSGRWPVDTDVSTTRKSERERWMHGWVGGWGGGGVDG